MKAIGLTLILGLGLTEGAIAQVIPDSTVGTIVSPINLIDGGLRSGNNLFHSFSQFSIPTGGSAIFNNPIAIQNIFSRVTGTTQSSIDGLIKARGNASLFLMNPNGILFGSNAKLDIGGSFIGTTANSIKFADGVQFSASDVTPNPLLTVNVPIGLQMGRNTAAIRVTGPGHRLNNDNAFAPIANPNNTTSGLRVNPGQTLSLIGGGIDLQGGILVAPSGHIELGSGSNGSVEINVSSAAWRFDYRNVQQFADIRFSQQALADTSGAPAGSLQLQGRHISLLNGSVALLANFSGDAQGSLVVNAADLLELRGVGNAGFGDSQLASENFGTGTGTNLTISAQRLQLRDGGEIIARNYGSGAGGNITIEATNSIDMQGFSAINPDLASAIIPVTYGVGNSGDVTISTGQLQITDGALISNVTVGTGRGGNTTVRANDWMKLVGENPVTFVPSSIAASNFNRGDSGKVTITAPRLIVSNGGAIAANLYGSGSAGDATITGSEQIEVSGFGLFSGSPSRIAARSERLSPILQQVLRLPPEPTGSSGNLLINTPSLVVRDGAVVGVNHQGVGNAGNLQINAGTIGLDRGGRLSSATQSGRGGDMILQADRLILRRGSRITATAGGSGDGGNIMLNVPVILGLENSDIIANASAGSGGNIQITTQGIFGLKYRDRLTPENDITASSEFGVNGTVQVNSLGLDPSSGLVALASDVIDSIRSIAKGCAAVQGNSFISTGRGGIPLGPLKMSLTDRSWHDLRDTTTPTPIAAIQNLAFKLVEATRIQANLDGSIALIDSNSVNSINVATCAIAP